jgi:hypothetical protein
MISHIRSCLVITQRTVRYSLYSIIRVPITVVVANIGVEDRGGAGLALLGRSIIHFGSNTRALQLLEALCIFVVFRHDVDAPSSDFAIGVNIEEEGCEG